MQVLAVLPGTAALNRTQAKQNDTFTSGWAVKLMEVHSQDTLDKNVKCLHLNLNSIAQ